MNGPTGRPVVLTVAGSDNSAGAGLQADLKTIGALGGYGLSAVTCVVAEVPGKVSMIQPVRPAVVAEQIRLSFEAFPVAAVKTGMLYSTAIIEAAIDALVAASTGRKRKPALVVDPVMIASSGAPLLKPSAIRAYRCRLFPQATLITPNLNELESLTGKKITTVREMEAAGLALAAEFGTTFLLKGGHLRGRMAVDLLTGPAGESEKFAAPFVRGVDAHGTGCAYSAAIATGLARGLPASEAVRAAKAFITRAIRTRLQWGRVAALNLTAPPEGPA